MKSDPRLEGREVVRCGRLTLKAYIFDSVSSVENAKRNMTESLPLYVTDTMGGMGVAFLYGYEGDFGYVDGADIMVYRNPEELNSMIDSLTIENGESIKREKSIMCGYESIILAEEEKIRRTANGRADGYLCRWPEIASKPWWKSLTSAFR